jgi:hypothetical protein
MNILDHISESFEKFFVLLKFFGADADPDPGSGNLFDPEYGIRDGKKFGSGINTSFNASFVHISHQV